MGEKARTGEGHGAGNKYQRHREVTGAAAGLTRRRPLFPAVERAGRSLVQIFHGLCKRLSHRLFCGGAQLLFYLLIIGRRVL